MKKIISLILASVLSMLLLSACTLGKCDFCGKAGIVEERSIFGTTIYICYDCG